MTEVVMPKWVILFSCSHSCLAARIFHWQPWLQFDFKYIHGSRVGSNVESCVFLIGKGRQALFTVNPL